MRNDANENCTWIPAYVIGISGTSEHKQIVPVVAVLEQFE